MNKPSNTYTYLYWLPRILAITFALFLAIFALDVFIPGQPVMYYLTALTMHLLPNSIILGLLLVAWKFEKLGGILFILFGVISIIFFDTYSHIINFVIVSFPFFLIGGLFVAHDTLATKKTYV